MEPSANNLKNPIRIKVVGALLERPPLTMTIPGEQVVEDGRAWRRGGLGAAPGGDLRGRSRGDANRCSARIENAGSRAFPAPRIWPMPSGRPPSSSGATKTIRPKSGAPSCRWAAWTAAGDRRRRKRATKRDAPNFELLNREMPGVLALNDGGFDFRNRDRKDLLGLAGEERTVAQVDRPQDVASDRAGRLVARTRRDSRRQAHHHCFRA